MGKHKLTPEEEMAYADLARAAGRLRAAQERAGRQRYQPTRSCGSTAGETTAGKAVPHAR